MKSRTILAAIFLFIASIVSFTDVMAKPPLPYGTYLQSCINCRTNGFTLSCWCRSHSGRLPTFSKLHYANQCKFVENLSGHLYCSRGYVEPLPAGSYREDCKHCSFDGDLLSCSCMSRIGYFMHQVELPNAGNCQSDIAYTRDGLKCTGRSVPAAARRDRQADAKTSADPTVAQMTKRPSLLARWFGRKSPAAKNPAPVVAQVESTPAIVKQEPVVTESVAASVPEVTQPTVAVINKPAVAVETPVVVTHLPATDPIHTIISSTLANVTVTKPVVVHNEQPAVTDKPLVTFVGRKTVAVPVAVPAKKVEVATQNTIPVTPTSKDREALSGWISSLLVSAEKEVLANPKIETAANESKTKTVLPPAPTAVTKTVMTPAPSVIKAVPGLHRSMVVDPVAPVKPVAAAKPPVVSKSWKSAKALHPWKKPVAGKVHRYFV